MDKEILGTSTIEMTNDYLYELKMLNNKYTTGLDDTDYNVFKGKYPIRRLKIGKIRYARQD